MSVFNSNDFRIVIECASPGYIDGTSDEVINKVYAPAVTTEVLTTEEAAGLLAKLTKSVNRLKTSLDGKSPTAMYASAVAHASSELGALYGSIGQNQTQVLLASNDWLDDSKLKTWNVNNLYRAYKQYLFSILKTEQMGLSDAAMLQTVKGVYQLVVPEVVNEVLIVPLTSKVDITVNSAWLPSEQKLLGLGTKDAIYVARTRLGLGYLEDMFLDPVSDYIRKAVNGVYEASVQETLDSLRLDLTTSFAELNKDTKLKVYALLNDIGLKRGQRLLVSKALSKSEVSRVLINDVVIQLLNHMSLLELPSFVEEGYRITLRAQKALLQCDYQEIPPSDYGLDSFEGYRNPSDLPPLPLNASSVVFAYQRAEDESD